MKTETVTGIVDSIDDPAKAGRIKVSVASMDGQGYPEWVKPVFTAGWIAMPEPGDEVELIMPEGEDIVEFAEEVRYRGRVLGESHPVPDAFQENYPKRRGFMSEAGHFLMFDDDGGIILATSAGAGGNVGLTIDAKTGQVRLYGTSSVQIATVGAVTIAGTSCTILGRPVTPGGGPI